MRKFALFAALIIANFSNLHADEIIVEDVLDWQNAGQYNRICSQGVRDLFIRNQDSGLANLYASACLKVDKINELAIPIVMLYKTKQERENALIYATILYQKKMLYYAIVDQQDISDVRSPRVDYVLSYIFDKFVRKDFTLEDEKHKFDLATGVVAKVYAKNEENIDKMVVEIFKDNKLVSTKTYW